MLFGRIREKQFIRHDVPSHVLFLSLPKVIQLSHEYIPHLGNLVPHIGFLFVVIFEQVGQNVPIFSLLSEEL